MLRISLLATLLAATATGATAQRGDNCTIFNWDENNSYLTKYSPQRVSGASSCPDNSENLTCPLTASGDAQYTATYNISALNIESFIDVVLNTVNNDTLSAPSFNATVVGSIDTTKIIEAGQSAYLNFTAYKFCYEGSVANCTDGVEDGTPLRICAPVWHEEGSWRGDEASPRFDGEYTIVNISREDVSRYPDPYENQVGDEPGEGGAVGLNMNVGLAGLVGLVAAMVV
ncbi:uncharacterized protein BDV17DRAFT_55560 [Aspergillus undulatus]|uniref:uncharacterized protein n=1 Tax=Aspergillus undulatus TaxID=1810928 RepID=UPI003CCE51DC